jgi:hypothetical protein
VLENDNGIIAIALKLYLERIETENGDPALYNRVLELYHNYRDQEDE